MSKMPSKASLQAAVSETFSLQDRHGALANMELLSVDDGTPMNRDYVCYSAVFGLPVGFSATQGTYRVSRESGESWPLFLTAIVPDASGRERLEAFFHLKNDVDNVDEKVDAPCYQ